MKWWRRWFPGRWTAAEILWIQVRAHQKWLRIQPLTDPPSPEFVVHRSLECWKCQAWNAVGWEEKS